MNKFSKKINLQVVSVTDVVQPEVETIEFSKLKDLELIGEGGFGEVYRAKHRDWGPVAFKKLMLTFIRENDR